MAKTVLIKNIGEFFTGDLANPIAPVKSIRIENGRIAAIDPPEDQSGADTVLDAAGGAVLPGLVDGHVHPVLGEWTPAQDAMGWIGNYLHGGTTTMISAGELHIPGIDYDNLTPELVTSLAVVTAATTGRVRWSGVKVQAGTALLVARHDGSSISTGSLPPASNGSSSCSIHSVRTPPRRAITSPGRTRAACARKFTPAVCRARARASFAATTCCRGCSRISPLMSAAARSR